MVDGGYKDPLLWGFERGTDLAEWEVRQLWRFRLRYLELKEHVVPEEDYHAFRHGLVQSRVIRFRRKGALKGFFVSRVRSVDLDGLTYRSWEPRWFFLENSCRRNSSLAHAFLREALAVFAQFPLQRCGVADGIHGGHFGRQSRHRAVGCPG